MKFFQLNYLKDEEWFNKDWFTITFPPCTGKDFSPEEIREGMIFVYKNYLISIGGTQILKYKTEEVLGIICHVTGQMVGFTTVISIKIINKAFYIGSSNMEVTI